MDLYKTYEALSNKSSVPRILGLTASVVKTARSEDITDSRVAENIAIIERRLCCKAVTYHDIEELVK